MKISNIPVYMLSGLANNSDSIIPMATKDTISNCAIVHTYKKEGGQDDARERAIEEFGTGAVWLFGIPTLKKCIDKFVYPLLNLNPDLDIRVLKDDNKINQIADILKENSNPALKKEKEVFKNLQNNPNLKKAYKNAYIGKFAFATAASAVLLALIIKHKQKTTNQRIQRDLLKQSQEKNIQQNLKEQDLTSKILMNKKIENNDNYLAFTSNKKQNSPIPFKGIKALGDLFLYNPIANTSILDGVITSTRLIEARKGERKEVFLKEAFQLLFIYGLAKPIQLAFEKLGNVLKIPIELDPKTLFNKNIENNLQSALEDSKSLDMKNLLPSLYKLDPKSKLIEILSDNGVISTIKDKNGEIQAVSCLKDINLDDVQSTIKNMEKLNENIKNIKGIKAFKAFAVLGNVAIAAWAMGVLQPKVNIWMRKLLNNGDNRNPAIVAQEKALREQQEKNQTI